MKNIEKKSRRTSVFHNRKYLVGNTPKMGVFVPTENQRFTSEGVSEAMRWVSFHPKMAPKRSCDGVVIVLR